MGIITTHSDGLKREEYRICIENDHLLGNSMLEYNI